MNPLYNLLGGNANPFQGTQFGNFMNFMNAFNQFLQSFQGNPQQQIQSMLQSGQISQEQYNHAVQQTQAIQRFMNGFK